MPYFVVVITAAQCGKNLRRTGNIFLMFIKTIGGYQFNTVSDRLLS